MPTLPINHNGDYLYYVDTQEPPGAQKTYTTLMLVHGTAYHGATFKRLIPLAERYKLRLVIINRRDYPGSSVYSEEELGQLRSGDAEMHNAFAQARANEFATFIKNFVEQDKNIPQISEDGKSGGIVLMGWSAGNNFVIPLLAYADVIDKDVREKVEPYLRSLMLFEIPQWGVGAPTPDSGLMILRNETLSVGERATRFNEWISGYYDHKSVSSRNTDDLQHLRDPESPPATIDMLSPDEIAEITWYPAVARHEVASRSAQPKVYRERIQRMICGEGVQQCFGKCRVDFVWCENSTWGNVNASWIFEQLVEDADKEGMKRRECRITMIPGPKANHFAHWDNPEKAMEYFAKVISV